MNSLNLSSYCENVPRVATLRGVGNVGALGGCVTSETKAGGERTFFERKSRAHGRALLTENNPMVSD